MPLPPQRDSRFHEGATVARSIRVNECLWESFTERVGQLGYGPMDAIRWFMLEVVQPGSPSTAPPPVATSPGGAPDQHP